MKNLKFKSVLPFILLSLSLSVLYACDDNNDDEAINEAVLNQTLTQTDKDALLFMLEEEKLARDTYMYLNNLWSVNQFANIKNSEQTHMNAIENLLIQYNVEYTILPEGEFANTDLQNLYNQFVIDGNVSVANALQIGATIEDLDIVDLEERLALTSNTAIISVFQSLQCGSRNHLRSFVFGIENGGNTYTPQYLTQEDYNTILEGSHEQCN